MGRKLCPVNALACISLAICLVAGPSAVRAGRGHIAEAAPQLLAQVRMDVDAQGLPHDIKVSASAPAFVPLIKKHAATWRFAPAQWQGHAVAASFERTVDLELVPTTQGGYAVRMKGFGRGWNPARVPMPADGTFLGFSSYVLYGLLVDIDATGRVIRTEGVLPRRHPGQQSKAFARRVETPFSQWQGQVQTADGMPVACRRLFIEEHTPNRVGTSSSSAFRGWADDVDVSTLPEAQQAAVTEELAKLDAQGMRCPSPVLLTKIAGELL